MPLSAFISTPQIWKVLEETRSSTLHLRRKPLACAAGTLP
jgi:hypothetical protein